MTNLTQLKLKHEMDRCCRKCRAKSLFGACGDMSCSCHSKSAGGEGGLGGNTEQIVAMYPKEESIKSKIERGAEDFANRFEGVMKELSEEEKHYICPNHGLKDCSCDTKVSPTEHAEEKCSNKNPHVCSNMGCHCNGICCQVKYIYTAPHTESWEDRLKDITHSLGKGIRGTCGTPCHQCERDVAIIAFIESERKKAKMELADDQKAGKIPYYNSVLDEVFKAGEAHGRKTVIENKE